MQETRARIFGDQKPFTHPASCCLLFLLLASYSSYFLLPLASCFLLLASCFLNGQCEPNDFLLFSAKIYRFLPEPGLFFAGYLTNTSLLIRAI